MSVISAIFGGKTYGYEDAFGAADCTSPAMQRAIEDWFRLFYMDEPTETEDPCQRIPYTIVNKIVKTAFGEYKATGTDGYTQMVLDGLGRARQAAMQAALIGGEAFIKPTPLGDRFAFTAISRNSVLIFGRDVDGRPTDIGTSEYTAAGGGFYTLLERRTIGRDGLLTIRNKLYRSTSDNDLGKRVPLGSLPKYAELPDEYTYPEPVSLGLVRLRTPMANCVDGSTDGVSVYAAAVGLIHNINRNELQLSGEFERGESRIIVSDDMLQYSKNGQPRLRDKIFVGLDDNPGDIGITAFSPALREQSFLARKTEYLRNVESIVGLKRGLLSDVEAAEKTATEITSSAGDYNLTIIDFQQMWEGAAREAAVLCGRLGRLYRIPGAHELDENTVSIDWGNGILYDESKTWTDYKSMVAAGLLKPEIAVGWYFNMPTETEDQREFVRQRYMPGVESLSGDL